MAETPLLSVRNLGVDFRQGGNVTVAVEGASFDIGRGETVALVGESGSGKSVTALSVMHSCRLRRRIPAGEIFFKGKDLLKASDRELRAVRGNDIGIIFQEPMTSLNPLHTIERQVGEILKIHRGMGDSAARARVLELLDAGRHPRSRKPARRLSAPALRRPAPARHDRHGARQRAGPAHRRRADDGARRDGAGADPEAPARPAEARPGMAMLFITHDLGIVRRMAKRVCVMTKGKIVEQGRPRQSSPSRSTPTPGICSPPSRRAIRRSPIRRRRS